jgi:hypothetical protein
MDLAFAGGRSSDGGYRIGHHAPRRIKAHAAILFGITHDEVSYSASNEYFTKFKFIQFRFFDTNLPDRFRVGEVGLLASWWMGIPLGILCGLPLMRHVPIWSLPVIATFTFAIALAGLASRSCAITSSRACRSAG